MKFTCPLTEKVYDTNNYLNTFVDEYTGEIIPNKRVLDRRIRKLWFRSVFPNAIIKHKVEITSMLDKVLDKITNVTAEQLDTIREIAKEGKAALAYVEIVDNGDIIAENYALRRATTDGGNSDGNKNESFEYYTEAALNAALERALIDLGFVVSEEIEIAPNPDSGDGKKTQSKGYKNTPKKVINSLTDAQKAIVDIETLVDSGNAEVTDAASGPCYDKGTPVEEIIKIMSETDARAYVFTCNGKYKGKTVGEVYEADKDNNGHSNTLSWFAGKFINKDNILVAACKIVNA